ncbi:Coiled-coil domain-containing protein 175 [Merluccius polli]|uniref:Coiled-coil domain-containing protein 175 n=1 Tax=Merluccius polli TaxID=89951 RepID=A0AA47MEM1_MERPO|nr:Coiled-coil domain-containing protein 175 [Merluccius polli]
MASCLVPDFPAVMMALEHLGELDRRLREEKVPFSPEAGHHLKEIAAAVTKLEASRRSAHEQLEVETIENGKVRHQLRKAQDEISRDIMADVAAARESNAKELEGLRADLNGVSELHRAAASRQEDLVRQNAALRPERERLKAKHEGDMAVLNRQTGLRLGGRVRLGRTSDRAEEVKARVAAAERDAAALRRDAARERETFDEAKGRLLGEMERAKEERLQQRRENARKKKELDRGALLQLDTDDRLAELTHRSAQLGRAVERLTASREQHERQLTEAAQDRRDAARQKESREGELCALRRHYETTGQRLQEDLILVDRDLDEGRAAGGVRRERLADVAESFEARRREEDEARSLYLNVSRRLDRSTLRLEDRLASIARHRVEAREMEEETGRLLETDVLNRALFLEGREKLRRRTEVELRNTEGAEEEKGSAGASPAGSEAGAGGARGARGRYRELCREEVTLRRSLTSNDDEVDLLDGQVTRAARDLVQTESGYGGEMERLAGDTERVLKESEAKERELGEREATLGEAQARFDQEESTLRGLERLIARLKEEKSHLERSTEDLRENTGNLQRPREEMKAALEATRARHRGLLVSQASELRAVEAGIGDGGRKLEQVSMENSRMRLSILRMKEDIADARKDKEGSRKRIMALREEERALFERVLQGWREDLLVTGEGRDGNRHLLEAFGGVLGQLGNKGVQFESVNACVQQLLLHISKLGY